MGGGVSLPLRSCLAVCHTQLLERRQDLLIASLRGLHGRDEELTAVVKREVKKVRLSIAFTAAIRSTYVRTARDDFGGGEHVARGRSK